MPVNPTYPGIYIEELPSTNFTITPAPTSVAVFIGYTHPFKTKAFGKAVPVFNFTEFERAFGGYIASGVFSGHVALSISQFFLNGGSDAYVVGLKPQYHTAGAATEVLDPAVSSLSAVPLAAPVMNPQATFAKGTTEKLVVYALEPTDQVEMRVAFFLKDEAKKKADIRVTYGSQVEMFRDVDLTEDDRPTGIQAMVNSFSQLIRIRKLDGATFPSGFDFTANEQVLSHGTPAGANTFAEEDFTAVLKDDLDLDKVPVFNLMIIPGMSQKAVLDKALAYCERKRAFFIMDPPPLSDTDNDGDTVLEMKNAMDNTAKHINGALYYPELVSTHPMTKRRIELPPSGTVAGVFARTDTQFGVWKAPAGIETTLRGVTGVVEVGRVTDKRHGMLNLAGVNVLRTFPGIGTVVYGSRTLESANPSQEQWKYVPVRRMALFIEQTLLANLTWVVFRPNDEPLWAAIRASITGFMMSLFRQGAFQGDSPSKAFQVKCDAETTTQTDINLGRVNIVVAFAPLKPAEFVIIKIAQLAGQAEA